MSPGDDRTAAAVHRARVRLPELVPTIADQLRGTAAHNWRGYMEDMGKARRRNATAATQRSTGPTKRRPLGRPTSTRPATTPSSTSTRSSITPPASATSSISVEAARRTRAPSCHAELRLHHPDLCADGHDGRCANAARRGGYAGINAFLRTLGAENPALARLPEDHGLLIVTFDESRPAGQSCCNEPTGPNPANNGGTQSGDGGGKVGAVMVSPCIKPGTVTQAPYNHYSMLRWVEDNFGLDHLAEAAAAGSAVLRPRRLQPTRLRVEPPPSGAPSPDQVLSLAGSRE